MSPDTNLPSDTYKYRNRCESNSNDKLIVLNWQFGRVWAGFIAHAKSPAELINAARFSSIS